ncbi:MAG: PilZ domain-containing protein [Kofleriaceae bacterium]
MDQAERRRHHRADTELGARIHAAGLTVRGRSVDLSCGGVRIRRDDDQGPCPAVGTAAMIELEVGPRGWLAQDGRIVRCDFSDLAIAFDALAPDVAGWIEAEVRTALAAVSRPRLVVVDPSIDRRHHIAERLRAAGCDPYEAATPLEAIDLIERPSNHIAGVAVAEHLTAQTDGDEFCEFVAETNPGIRIAVINDGLTASASGRRPARITAVDARDDDSLERSLKGFLDAVHTPPPPRR